jgi:hypothetical protein
MLEYWTDLSEDTQEKCDQLIHQPNQQEVQEVVPRGIKSSSSLVLLLLLLSPALSPDPALTPT